MRLLHHIDDSLVATAVPWEDQTQLRAENKKKTGRKQGEIRKKQGDYWEKTGKNREKTREKSGRKQGENKEKAGRRQRENKGENIDKNDWGTFTPKL